MPHFFYALVFMSAIGHYVSMNVRTVAGATLLFTAVFFAVFSSKAAFVLANEETVRTTFADTPVMIEIARCESKFTQFTQIGEPLHGGYQSKMIGVFQIYEDIHAVYAKSLGMDITTLEGNIAYARFLYNSEGTQPWMSSFPCWGKESTSNDSSVSVIAHNLSFGMVDSEVKLLQQILNEKEYVIALEGPGSRGNETEKFGFLTRDAVRKFQCTEMQLCDGNEYSNGYGFVGSKTRVALSRTQGVVTTPLASTTSSVQSVYSDQQLKEITALQAYIADLTRILTGLLATRGPSL